MKTNFFFILMLATALMGCSNTENNNLEENSYLRIGSCRTQGEEITAITDFGMFVTTGDGSGYDDHSNNIHVIQQHGKWEIPSILMQPDKDGNLFAYYPYAENATVTEIPVSLQTQTDYLFSKGQTVTYSAYTPDIELHHLLSKVTVEVNEQKVESISVQDYPSEGTLNLFGGNLTKSNNKATLTSGKSEILLFPGNNEGLSLDITYQGKHYAYQPIDTNFEAGKEYIHSLILQEGNTLSLGQVTIKEWQVGGNYEGTIDTENNI
mgnify:CR=1 FL=1